MIRHRLRRVLRWLGFCHCGGLLRPSLRLPSGRPVTWRCDHCGRLA
jgi:hypothetical protein